MVGLDDRGADLDDTETVEVRAAEWPTSPADGEVDGEADGDVVLPLVKGSTVGRYVIGERLGAGGMGVVYRAHDPQLDREVALKLLLPKRGDDPLQSARMLREAKAAAKIKHPNVVTVYDAGEADGRVFIAMELMHGVDLGKWFAEPRPWQEVVRVMIQAARGLRAAHDAGLVHRDFKPENVLLEDDGSVKVLDFGLARTAYDAQTQAKAAEELALRLATTVDGRDGGGTRSVLAGTLPYMAPEQHLQGDLDHRADQFSFCVALYQGVYGERPFRGGKHALIVNVVTGNFEAPQDAKLAPARLLSILRKGLASDPRHRHRSMDALIDELQALLEREESGRSVGLRWLMAGLATAALAVPIVLGVEKLLREPTVERPDGVGVDAPVIGGEAGQPPSPPPVPELEPELAEGRGRNRPVEGPRIWITTEVLRVSTQRGSAPLDVPLVAGRGADSSGPDLTAIHDALASVGPADDAAAFEPLTLFVDRRTPFATILQVIDSASRAGFLRYDFAVRSNGDVRVLEVKPPAPDDETQRRRLALELALDSARVLVAAREWAHEKRRWPLDTGAGSCELGDLSGGEPQVLAKLAAELCAIDDLGVPLILSSAMDVEWGRIAKLLSAASPSSECAHGIVLDPEPPGPEPDDCSAALTVAELAKQMAEPPEFRRWCFINTKLRSEKSCFATQAECYRDANIWLGNPQRHCKGER